MEKKNLYYIAGGIVVCAAIVVLAVRGCGKEAEELPLEPTAVSIMKVMPKDEMYVASAVYEDFTTLQKTEYHLGIFPEKHSCVQTLRQKVGFKVDMSKVKYEVYEGAGKAGRAGEPLAIGHRPLADSGKPGEAGNSTTVLVTMPEPEYTASTVGSAFFSDDEGYWREALPSNNGMKREVERKIRKQFDTRENRRKAILYAEEAIGQILAQLGYQAEFVSESLPSPQTDSF